MRVIYAQKKRNEEKLEKYFPIKIIIIIISRIKVYNVRISVIMAEKNLLQRIARIELHNVSLSPQNIIL